jgi:hypothetical protein
VAGADRWIIYPTHQHALDALAAACLLYGRRRGWPCPKCQGTGKGKKVTHQGNHYECAVCHGLGHTVEGG